MTKVLAVIAWRDILAQIRSRSFLVQSLLMPIILTLMIGSAIGGTRKIDLLPVSIAGSGEIAKNLGEVLTQSGFTKVSYAPSAQIASQEVSTGKVTVAVILPERLETKLLRAEPLEVQVLLDPSSHQRGEVVKQLVTGYLEQLEAARAAVLAGVRARAPASASELQETLTLVRSRVERLYQDASLELKSEEAQGRSRGIFAYYAVAFGVMFTLLSATNGAGGVLDELERGTLHRLLAAPVTPALLLFAKFVALWLLGVLQLGVFALGSSLLYGISWGTVWAVLPVLLATAAAAAGFGGIIIGLTRSREQLNTMSLVFVLVMSLLGGSMWPLETLPGVAQILSKFTYNRWSIEAFQLAAIGESNTQLALSMLVLLGMALVGVGFGAWQLSRRFGK
ncbi:MAG: ABC transporter permease [Deinococcales bacterium]